MTMLVFPLPSLLRQVRGHGIDDDGVTVNLEDKGPRAGNQLCEDPRPKGMSSLGRNLRMAKKVDGGARHQRVDVRGPR